MRFAAGCTMTALALSSWPWWAPACLVIGIATFWKPLARLTTQVWQDFEMRRIASDLASSPHIDADAKTAWEYFHG